jgi:hypothetical protein
LEKKRRKNNLLFDQRSGIDGCAMIARAHRQEAHDPTETVGRICN